MSIRKVFITGIHTGLGYALAKRCLAQGATVLGTSRQVPTDLAEHSQLRFVPLDLRRDDEIAGALAQLFTRVQHLDLALLNAGVLGQIKDLRDTTLAECRGVMDVNVWANKIIIDALLGSELRVKQIVAILSGAAFNGSGGWGAYSISKSALNLLIRAYSYEHPETHFTALAPGVVETKLIHYILEQPDEPRHPANGRIKAAMAESQVMSPDVAAEKILARAVELLERPTGAYVDIRKM